MIKAVVFACLAAVACARPQQLPAGVTNCYGTYPFCSVTNANLAVPGGGFQYAAEQKILQTQYDLAQPIAATNVPGFAAHQAAEAQQLAAMGLVPGSIIHAGQEAKVKQAEAELIALQAQQYAAAPVVAAAPVAPAAPAFTGLVGPSGVIGPSGAVGPAGPVAFY